ncbi:amidohydrolase family protein [Chloracidobacterium validum]|uniref:Amidohydrolase family protein n=1 Tax=Chloracidobacterium validum TaxID=2821543 RepID=A0ABX8BGT6_9BACT|nr:amidohydrolase family protein [Chloracidobacterium validum]QUW04700.1 amidohydrolase family protein [Chloracidobacterium validum]
MLKSTFSVLLCLLLGSALGSPAVAQSERPGDVTPPRAYAIVNARLIPVAGPPIERGTIVIRDGLIVAVGADVKPPADVRQLDGTGLTVYPGLIDAVSHVGFQSGPPAAAPTGIARATPGTPPATVPVGGLANSIRPTGFQPELLAAELVRTNGDGLEPARQAGFTTALTVPRDGIVMGRSAVIALGAGSPRDMVIRTPVALHITFRVVSGSGYPNSLMGVFSMVRQAFLDAQQYQAHWAAYRANPRGLKRPADDPSLEALLPALSRDLPVVFHADTEREIIRALDFAQEFNLRPIIAGGREAEKVTDRLKAAQATVLLSLNFPKRATSFTPEADPEPLSLLRARVAALKTATALHNAGIPFAFQTGGLTPADAISNVKKAVDNGLPAAEAIRALTLRPADIFGLADRLGTLDVGKVANLVAVRGDLFDAKRRVAFVFIDGAMVNLRGTNVTPTEISGTWETKGLTLTFSRDNGELKGKARSGDKDLELRELRLGLDEDASLSTVRFVADLPREGGAKPATFTGKYTGDELRGAFVVDGRSEAELVFKRGTAPPSTPGTAAGGNGAATFDFTGTWNLVVSFGPQSLPATMTLRQEGTSLTGTLSLGPLGTATLSNGRVTGNRMEATAQVDFGGRSIELQLSGTGNGNSLEGSVVSPQGTASISGTRPQ